MQESWRLFFKRRHLRAPTIWVPSTADLPSVRMPPWAVHPMSYGLLPGWHAGPSCCCVPSEFYLHAVRTGQSQQRAYCDVAYELPWLFSA